MKFMNISEPNITLNMIVEYSFDEIKEFLDFRIYERNKKTLTTINGCGGFTQFHIDYEDDICFKYPTGNEEEYFCLYLLILGETDRRMKNTEIEDKEFLFTEEGWDNFRNELLLELF